VKPEDLRPRPTLIVTIAADAIRIHLPGDRKRFLTEATTLATLGAVLEDGAHIWQALAGHFGEDAVAAAAEVLLEGGVLERRPDSGPSRAEQTVDAWAPWEESSWFLHLRTQDTKYAVEEEDFVDLDTELAASGPPPPSVKCSCTATSATVDLPAPSHLDGAALAEALVHRRTCRSFSDHPIDIAELAAVLWYTGGVQFTADTGQFGRVAYQSAPSPGARHPTELYPIVRSCAGVPPGVYHYCASHHRITRLKDGDPRPLLEVALSGQTWFEDAAVTVFYTAVMPRVWWKYASPRAYRLVHYEIGHHAQNFLLVGTALRRGVFVTGALKESAIEAALSIDGIEEVVMYATGIGVERAAPPWARDSIKPGPAFPAGLTRRYPTDDGERDPGGGQASGPPSG
jgi:SagB-type dehydrogenase family enzyme